MANNKPNQYERFVSESSRTGPRQFEVPYVINNLVDGPAIEIGGNDSLFKWVFARRGWPFTLIDPMGVGLKHKLATCIRGDIRKHTPKKLGTFPNVLLVSVLEHISLPAYNQKKDWQGSPRAEQLKAFKHCMKFVKPGGRIIVTLPHSNAPAEQDPKFSLRYNNNMLADLYREGRLLDQSFFRLEHPTYLDRWKTVSQKQTVNHRSNVCFVLEKPK